MNQGMINSAIQNSILKAAEQKIESQLTPDNRNDYMKIVVAGLKVALNGGPRSIIAGLQNSKDPLHDCALGAINLCAMLSHQSRGTMPVKAMVPAAMSLMLHALDFADKAGILKVGTPELVKATHVFTNLIFQRLHVSPQMLQTAAGKLHALSQDPVAMEKMKRAAGMVRAPGASEATVLPEGEGA